MPPGVETGYPPSLLHQRSPVEAGGEEIGNHLESFNELLLDPGLMESWQGRTVGQTKSEGDIHRLDCL